MEQQEAAGYVLRGADGTLYLIRDEVLAACKIDGGDLEYARKFEADGAGENALSTSGPFTAWGRVDDTCATHPLEICEARPEPAETLMCAW